MKVGYSFPWIISGILIIVAAKVKDDIKDIKKDLGRVIKRLNNIESCTCGSYKPPSQSEMAIVVSGGYPWPKTAEAFLSDGKRLCEIIDLPVGRADHTMDSGIACGGVDTPQNCTKFEDGKWMAYSSNLVQPRVGHVSWKRFGQKDAIQLMGGVLSPETSEIVSPETSVSSYPLTYWGLKHSCSIQFNDYVVVAGGLYGSQADTIVVQYGSEGHIGDLPRFNNRRYSHGCGSFVNDEGNLVYLVAGGKNGGNGQMIGFEKTTEMIVTGETSWTIVGDLPSPRAGLRGASVDNNIFMTGGYWAIEGGQSVEDETFSEILIFNKDLKSWTKTDYLFKPRFSHAVSALPLDKIQPHCNA